MSLITKSRDATANRNGVMCSMLTFASWIISPIFNWMSKFESLLKMATRNQKKMGKPTAMDIPVEIWEMIIGHLNDSQDWLNLYWTCTYFRNLMEENKVATLLPGVLKILSDQTDEDIKLSGVDFKTLRLVGKSWNKIVSSYLSHHPCIQDLLLPDVYGYNSYATVVAPSLPSVFSDIEESDFQKMKDILTQVKSDKSVVIFSRHLILKGFPFHATYREDYDFVKIQKNMETILSFVKKVGPSIWHFVVGFSEYHDLTELNENWYEVLINILQLLPNLKSLFVNRARQPVCFRRGGFSFGGGASCQIQSSTFSRSSSPPVGFTSRYEIQRDRNFPADILFESLERFGATLTHLSAGRVVVPENWNIQIGRGFPKLRLLALQLDLENGAQGFVIGQIKQKFLEALKCLKDVGIKITGY